MQKISTRAVNFADHAKKLTQQYFAQNFLNKFKE